MRKSFLLLCLIGLLNARSAAACDIVNTRQISIGTSEGIAGECSNTGRPIECIDNGGGADGLNCNGPEGSLNGSNLQQLIFTVCGCGLNPGNDGANQMRQELRE